MENSGVLQSALLVERFFFSFKKPMDVFMNPYPTLESSLFGLSLEEEKMKNLTILVREASTFPHVIILFDQIDREVLFFSVLVASPHSLHLATIESLDPMITFLPEKVRFYSSIEAHMFRLSMPIVPFLQKGRIHFPKARKRIVQALKKVMGEFRDYNGGFLEKREELLEEIQTNMSEDPFIIEELFYSLVPASCQATSSSSLLEMFFKKCLAQIFSENLIEIDEQKMFTFVHLVHMRPDFLFSMQKKLYDMDLIYTHLKRKNKTHLFCLIRKCS